MAEKKHDKRISHSGEAAELKSKEKTSPTINEMDRTERAEMEKLRSEIAKDRHEAQATIEAIKERLSPGHLKDQAQDKIREVTVGKAKDMAHTAKYKAKNVGYSVYDSIKENIAPTAMIGLGFAWLVKRLKGDGDYEDYYARESYRGEPYGRDEYLYTHDPYSEDEYVGGQFRHYPGTSGSEEIRGYYSEHPEDKRARASAKAREAKERVSGMAAGAREKVSEMTAEAREKAYGITAEAKEKARHAGERTSEMFDRARERAGEMGDRVKSGSKRAGYKSREMVDENPLLMAGILFAVGAAIGFLIPRTQKEDEWMGETRDELLEQAKFRGRDTMDRAREVARETGKAAAETAKETAKEEAKKQGLTSDENTEATSGEKHEDKKTEKKFTRTEDIWPSSEGVKSFKEP